MLMGDRIHNLPRLGIAAATRLFGLTPRALRFYEERGLIEVRRDRYNVRYYEGPARERLSWIARLRRADLSLPDIEHVLDGDDAETRKARALQLLEARRERVVAELEAIDDVAGELKGDAARPKTPAARAS